MASRTAHLSDPSINAFLQPDFDPADYLNTTLPFLSTTTSRPPSATRSVPLSELTTQLQALLNDLNAHTTRLSNALTQLTDEIVRIGGRLAYEVEVLRGDTAQLTKTLATTLKPDLDLFISASAQSPESDQPQYLQSLATLTQVRSRLHAVIQVFDKAMSWPLPPSEISGAATASLISVAAPETEETRAREAKGREYVDGLRGELQTLFSFGAEGVDDAEARVEELRALVEVWKGTAEEKARVRIVQGLSEEVGRWVTEDGGRKGAEVKAVRQGETKYGDLSVVVEGNEGAAGGGGGNGYGFLQNLRNLKNDMYLD